MFDRFTEQAQQTMNRARLAAQEFDHECLGTEHLLLGLLAVEDCAAARILGSLGQGRQNAREEVRRLMTPGAKRAALTHLPFTTGARRVLELSMEEAGSLRTRWIGTEHLLLGLLREPDGVGGKVLRGLGVDLARAREEARRIEAPEDGRAQHGGAIASFASRTNVEQRKKLLEAAALLLRGMNEEAAALEIENVLRRLDPNS